LSSEYLGQRDWPGYDFMSPDDYQGVSRLMSSEANQNWQEIMSAALFRQGERGEALGDIAVLRYGQWASHAALVVAPNKMLHVDKNTPTTIVEMRGLSWVNRITGIYRWV